MKLYTEEQMKSFYELGKFDGIVAREKDVDVEIKNYTPIELPSDEEIEDKGKWAFNDAGHTIFTHYNTVPSWVDGAKWMRDKIQGGNK